MQCSKTLLEERGNGLRSKTHEHAFVQAPARLRANVPSRLLRAASFVLRRGVVWGLGVKPRVCFSFAGVFFFKQKENAEMREVYII